jgi:hypothetical protein
VAVSPLVSQRGSVPKPVRKADPHGRLSLFPRTGVVDRNRDRLAFGFDPVRVVTDRFVR